MLSFLTRSQVVAVALLFGALLPLGCARSAGKARTGTPEDAQAVVELTDPGKPVPPERFPTPDAAQIGPGDFLDIRILGYPELSGTFLVAADGRINQSLVGSVQASGKTTEALDRDLTAAFSAYYRDVDVAVNVNARTERFVYVLGELGRPGRYDFRPGERVIHALADAGGYTNKAREDGIILLRREADGKDHVYRLDFSRLFAMVAPQDIYLQPGDVVFVPKSRYQTVYEFAYDFIDLLGRTATTALIVDDLSRRSRNLTIAR